MLAIKGPVESNICTVTLASGAVVAASVTAPLMRPPATSAKFIPDVVAPAVTVIGVPVVTLQFTTQLMLL